jgi:TRAP-type C4-dicarboxylate transport system substrate-binding protein
MGGRRVLTTSTNVPYIETMGAGATVQGIGEYYTSLEKGVADTILIHWPLVHDFKMLDLFESHTVFSSNNDHAGVDNPLQGVLMNKAKWDSIPPEYQAVITEELDWAHDATAFFDDNVIIETIKEAEGIGQTVYRITPDESKMWFDAAQVSLDSWILQAEEAGMSEADARDLYEQLQKAIENEDV